MRASRTVAPLLVAVALAAAAAPGEAALIDRGNGLVYDTDLDITWLQDARYIQTSGHDIDGLVSWGAALSWAANLEYLGATEWRLPDLWVTSSCNSGLSNCSERGELTHLFYTELGNPGGSGQPLLAGPFQNLTKTNFWFAQEYSSTYAWVFGTDNGNVSAVAKSTLRSAWAVHYGDIGLTIIPEPGSAALLLAGAAILALGRPGRRTERKQRTAARFSA